MSPCAGVSLAIVLLLGTSGLGEAAKILGVLPSGGTSHHFVGISYLRLLAKAGHDVTVLSSFPEKNPPPNWRDIELTGLKEKMHEEFTDPFEFADTPFIMNLIMMYSTFGRFSSEFTLNHPNVQKLLNSGEHFDLVIVEAFLAEAVFGMAQHFNASLITYSPFGSSLWNTELTGSPAPASHVSTMMLPYYDRMNFWERFWNTIYNAIDYTLYHQLQLTTQKELYDAAFPNAAISFEEQMKQVSLVFLNNHFSIGMPRPYAPNMIEVGGVQIDDPKPLPKDLQKFMDEAPDGVIYFSMGSYVRSEKFPEEKRNAFIKVFAGLKQRVLWKFEDESLPKLPYNLLIKAWMPQNDILAHPNVRAFITHGGLLGTTEAIYHGIPLVGIPIFGDQMMNVQLSARSGMGVPLLFKDINEQTVRSALEKVLTDPSYRENAKRMSKIYHDKPMTPKQTALYWMEYVIRHKGAPQLRTPAVELSFFQYHLIDVYCVMLLILGLVSLICVRVVKKCYSSIRKFAPKKSKKRD
ncbi:UDP-glycosyltransferase UGT5-like [Uranotaenia lowii]|uniref:UDP-glycosyltransferase UGT5-like n=1 Tax=Uranotaenia lowii TaxID=190385 RepID=UPI00247AEBF4|nr:UDP-glycosyltransferase UGT5-like [Uranotaenia lowii]